MSLRVAKSFVAVPSVIVCPGCGYPIMYTELEKLSKTVRTHCTHWQCPENDIEYEFTLPTIMGVKVIE